MSAVIVTLLLVALSVGLIVIVGTVVKNIVNQKLGQASSCVGSFSNDLTLDNQHTCYNSSANSVEFMVDIGSINLDGIYISITSPAKSETFTINNGTNNSISGLTDYYGDVNVTLPGEDSGVKYIYHWTGSDIPDSIQIAPIINGHQCSSSDSISSLQDCNLF